MRRLPGVSVGWAEGRYFDLWMLVHFLTGAVGGLSNVVFQLRHVVIYVLGGAMMVAWEIGERALGVRESLPNQAIDVGIGLVGVWIALWIGARLSQRAEYWLLGLTIVAALALMGVGVRAFKARTRS